MPFQIVHNDITKMETEAIVNSTNSRLKMGGGVCGAIFRAAGEKQLQEECDRAGLCPVGQSVLTRGYNLPAAYVIHTVGPVWQGGDAKEAYYLDRAYTSALELAKNHGVSSISIPLIASGTFGYPKEESLSIAVSAISRFLLKEEMDVYLVVYDRKSVSLSETLFSSISHYIYEHYQVSDMDSFLQDSRRSQEQFSQVCEDMQEYFVMPCLDPVEKESCKPVLTSVSGAPRKLEDLFDQMGETFSEMLMRLIDERGKKDVEVYKKANIDRKLFSKIRSNREYTPKKTTVLALAVSLELSLDETRDLLSKAGYALSSSQKGDVIVQYFIEKQEYNLYLINETLFCFEQPLLGSMQK